MKVTAVEAIPFRIPFRDRRVWARGALDAAEHVLVRIRTDQDGLEGVAEAPPRPTIYGESLQSILAGIEQWFGPATVGLDPFAGERLLEEFDRIPGNLTAKAAIDMALTDIRAKVAGVPVYRLLGGWTDRVPTTWRPPVGSVESVIAACAAMRERFGVKAFKVKIGMRPHEDILLIRELRAALGPDACLVPDANQGYDVPTAIRVLRAIEEFDITLVEEPCRIENDRGRQRVARETSIPLMGDESCTTALEVRRQLALGCLGVVSIKVARTGFAVSRRIAHLCELESVANLNGMQADTSLGSLCGAHFAASCRNVRFPCELASYLDTVDDLLVEPPRIEDGYFVLPQQPGLGIEIDEAKLEMYRL